MLPTSSFVEGGEVISHLTDRCDRCRVSLPSLKLQVVAWIEGDGRIEQQRLCPYCAEVTRLRIAINKRGEGDE